MKQPVLLSGRDLLGRFLGNADWTWLDPSRLGMGRWRHSMGNPWDQNHQFLESFAILASALQYLSQAFFARCVDLRTLGMNCSFGRMGWDIDTKFLETSKNFAKTSAFRLLPKHRNIMVSTKLWSVSGS